MLFMFINNYESYYKNMNFYLINKNSRLDNLKFNSFLNLIT